MEQVTQGPQATGKWFLQKSLRWTGLKYARMSAYSFTYAFLTLQVDADGSLELVLCRMSAQVSVS